MLFKRLLPALRYVWADVWDYSTKRLAGSSFTGKQWLESQPLSAVELVPRFGHNESQRANLRRASFSCGLTAHHTFISPERPGPVERCCMSTVTAPHNRKPIHWQTWSRPTRKRCEERMPECTSIVRKRSGSSTMRSTCSRAPMKNGIQSGW